jgi:glycosyltransferase involved in cell wall biosynthesis
MSGTVDVLIPTCNRSAALAITLAGLAAQTEPGLNIVVSDQSDGPASFDNPAATAVIRVLQARGHQVHALRHLPRRGMAEQRAFLLDQARGRYCLYLDDDVLLEPEAIERMRVLLQDQGCGFVGSALHGLSHHASQRPEQEAIEFWKGCVQPEFIAVDSPAWARHHLHSAANLLHVQRRLGLDGPPARPYKVAWVGGCVLFDTAKLQAAGGFDFWPLLPPDHCGEDVLAQLRVMARDGGCGMIPSGAYHLELPTTLPRRECDAPRLLWPRAGGAGSEASSQAA